MVGRVRGSLLTFATHCRHRSVYERSRHRAEGTGDVSGRSRRTLSQQTLRRDVAFRDQFDFDSMDTLNFAIGLSESFSIEVPETAYRRLASLAKAVDYVREQLAHKG